VKTTIPCVTTAAWLLLAFSYGCNKEPVASSTEGTAEARPAAQSKPLYTFGVEDIDGHRGTLGDFRGKVLLIVNVASQCGYTKQYAGLQTLHEQYRDRGLTVLAFPANNFGAQEPGAPDEIEGFCKKNYGVSFPMFSKLVTKAGPEQSAIYAYLGRTGSLPSWNVGKYLVDKQGRVVQYFASKVAPESPELREAIEKALAR